MLDRAAAQHRDCRCGIESRRDRPPPSMASRVEVSPSALRKRGCLISTSEARPRRDTAAAPKSSAPRGGKLGEALAPIGARQQHGMAEMATAGGMRECMGEQYALVDLKAILTLQRVRRLLPNLRGGRRQPGNGGRGLIDEVLGAHEAAETGCELAVERLNIGAEEVLAGLASLPQDQVAGGRLVGSAGKLCRQGGAQRRRLLPVERERGAIRSEIAGDARPGFEKNAAAAPGAMPARASTAVSSRSAACARALIAFLYARPGGAGKELRDQPATCGNGGCVRALYSSRRNVDMFPFSLFTTISSGSNFSIVLRVAMSARRASCALVMLRVIAFPLICQVPRTVPVTLSPSVLLMKPRGRTSLSNFPSAIERDRLADVSDRALPPAHDPAGVVRPRNGAPRGGAGHQERPKQCPGPSS